MITTLKGKNRIHDGIWPKTLEDFKSDMFISEFKKELVFTPKISAA